MPLSRNLSLVLAISTPFFFLFFLSYPRRFVCPGFVDTHVHAPQYTFTGTGYGIPLLEWLNKYTFSIESRFRDLEFASLVYPKGPSSPLSPISLELRVSCVALSEEWHDHSVVFCDYSPRGVQVLV